MTDATHLYLVAQGGYDDHPEESWQVGIRFYFREALVPPDTVGTLTPWGVVADATARTETDWNIANEFLGVAGAATLHPDDWLNDQCAPAFTAWMAAAHISNKVRLDSLKASPIMATGHVADLRTSRLVWTSANPHGAVSTNMLPPEVSVVTSWNTDVIGPRGRGRIYDPPSTVSIVDADGMLLDSAALDIRAAGIALLEGCAFNTAFLAGAYCRPIVTGAPWTAYGEITGVRVGHVFDAQRRRRRSLFETYDVGAVTY